MAYNEFLADRISDSLNSRNIPYEEKKMFGGLCYMINDKMCLGIVEEAIMARIGPEAYDAALKHSGVRPMEFTGKPMKGYVFVDPEALSRDEELNYWIDLCLEFNPKAKSSKKR